MNYISPMSRFPDTQWSLIRRSGDAASVRQEAFGELVRRYHGAVRAFFRARLAPEDAEDATQSFLTASYEHAWWARADADVGSFRGFLLMLLRRHLGHVLESRSLERVEVDDVDQLPNELDGERQFDARFVLTLTARAIDSLRTQYRDRGRGDVFETLLKLLSAPPEHGQLKQIADEMQMSANTLTVELRRLRSRLREGLADELRELCADEAAFERDWATLRDLLER